MIRITLLSLCTVLLAACAQSRENYQSYLEYYNVEAPKDMTTMSCRGYGCKIVNSTTLTKREWSYITSPLRKKPTSGEDEREKLRWVTGRFEEVMGERTGTKIDRPGTYQAIGDYQMDCSDESVNVTLYMLMLQDHGLLRYHQVGRPASRFPPHLTAVLIETATGKLYALDSWFHYNGVRAEVVPLEQWKRRWHPPKDDLRPEDVTPPKRW